MFFSEALPVKDYTMDILFLNVSYSGEFSRQVIVGMEESFEVVLYRGRFLREMNPLLREVLVDLRLKHTYIRSIVDMGVVGLEGGEYVCLVQLEHFPNTLQAEIVKRRAQRLPFTENELLYMLGQIVTGLNHAHTYAQMRCADITPAKVMITPQVVYKVDYGLPWTQSQRNSSPTALGDTLLSAASLKPSSSPSDISDLPYSDQFKALLHSLFQTDPPVSFQDMESSVCEITTQHLFTPFQAEINRRLINSVSRIRDTLGPYHFSTQIFKDLTFTSFQKRKPGFTSGSSTL